MSIPEVSGRHTHEAIRPERRSVSTRTLIEEAKARTSTLDLADRLCGPGKLRRVGDKWVARCPLPQHEDRSPSFTVYPETDSFFCFGCLVGGDVIELARHAWGYDKAEVAMAAALLLYEFGHDIPQRPPSWFHKRERQRHTRDAIEQTRKNSDRRRIFELLVLPHINTIEDEKRRNRELERAWTDFQRLLP